MRVLIVVWFFAMMAVFAGVTGCDSANADEQITLTLADLPDRDTNAAGVWQSTRWSGSPWHPYPGGVTLRVEHDLGRAPSAVLVYIAFSADGAGTGLASGDLARIVQVTDSEVTIRNGTEADLYCRIVLE